MRECLTVQSTTNGHNVMLKRKEEMRKRTLIVQITPSFKTLAVRRRCFL